MSKIFISAAHKSSGKTSISIGLCAALRKQGKIVQPFKKGPDYIDPHWLKSASERNCYNLDFYTMHEEEIKNTFVQYSADADISIIEGNKGLYDGLDLDGSNSNAALAKLLDTPVILVLDARGMTRGIAPLILGYQSFDRNIRIEGVILNQLGGSRHEEKLRSVIEHYTEVKVLGAVHHNDNIQINERHLGLIPSTEEKSPANIIEALRDSITESVDIDTLLNISSKTKKMSSNYSNQPEARQKDIKIGIIKNSAFGFYYPDDIEALQNYGAEIVYIDNLKDTKLPEINGLFIGGGFPETHMKKLEENSSFRDCLKIAIENNLPVYAECGGLMYLAKSVTWRDNKKQMVGVINGDIIMEDTPQGRGYVKLEETSESLWPDMENNVISAHEFHYSRFINLDKNARFAYRVLRGVGCDGEHDGYIYKNLLACFSHQRNTRDNQWAQRFTSFVRQSK